MKHEEIYHTCDRCGKKIKYIPEKGVFLQQYIRKMAQRCEMTLIEADPKAYITDRNYFADICSVKICAYYQGNEKKIDLCGDCLKAFERFMRNEET